MIDTPLGRLDGSHREHLLDRYFPYASHQVVLLSTDTEIDDEAYDRIAQARRSRVPPGVRSGDQRHLRRRRLLLGVIMATRTHSAVTDGARPAHHAQASNRHRALERPLPLGVVPVTGRAGAAADGQANARQQRRDDVAGLCRRPRGRPWALLRYRCHDDGLPLDEESLAQQFRLHLHRGIGYLVGDPRVTDVAGLASVGLGESPAA